MSGPNEKSGPPSRGRAPSILEASGTHRRRECKRNKKGPFELFKYGLTDYLERAGSEMALPIGFSFS